MPPTIEDQIPAAWMQPAAINQVVGYIRALAVRPSVKRQLLRQWALTVGAQVDPELYKYVAGVTR